MILDDDVMIYPSHLYRGSHSTIGQERKTNYILMERTLEEFVEFMRTLYTKDVWISLDFVEK